MRSAGRWWLAAAAATALIGAVACNNGVSGGPPDGGDGGPLSDGGIQCGFLFACPDGGDDGGQVDSGVPDSGVDLTRPSVRAIDPPDGYTFVGRDTAVKVDVNLPNVGQGVDETTLTTDNVRLLRQ